MSRIEIKDLSFRYGNRDHGQKKKVIDNVSAIIEGNQAVGIIGANGVGKSTLLKILVGLLPGYEGSIRVDDMELDKANLPDIRKRVGYVFQDSDSQLFMNTVYDDIAFGPRNYGMSEAEVDHTVREAMKKTHIEDLAGRHIYKLSGGQKKLAAIATVLSMGTQILLMDEPSVALDPENRENLIHILNELSGIKLIASHDLDFIYDTCDRILMLTDGQIVYDGDAKRALKDKELLEHNGLRLPLSFRFM